MKSEHTENDVDLHSVVYVCVSDNDVQVEKQYPELGKHEDVFDRIVSRILSQHKYYRSEKGRGHVVCQRHILCTHGCIHIKMMIGLSKYKKKSKPWAKASQSSSRETKTKNTKRKEKRQRS